MDKTNPWRAKFQTIQVKIKVFDRSCKENIEASYQLTLSALITLPKICRYFSGGIKTAKANWENTLMKKAALVNTIIPLY